MKKKLCVTCMIAAAAVVYAGLFIVGLGSLGVGLAAPLLRGGK